MHVAADGECLVVQVTADPGPRCMRRRPRVMLPGQGAHARLHARAARLGPAMAPCIARRAAPSRCWASAWACRCCSTTARSRTHRAWDVIPGRSESNSELGRPPAARRQPLQGAANGLEPSGTAIWATRGHTPLWAGVPDGSLLLLCPQLLRPTVGCTPQRR
jgi:hypothetical protein